MSSKKAKPEMNTETPAQGTAQAAFAAPEAHQVAEQVASFAQKSVDQAQAAFEKATEIAHGNVQLIDAAANAYKTRFTDIQLKSMEFAQLNVNAGFAFARKFFTLRDPAAALNLQQAFLKEQAEAMQRQAAELGELSVALAKDSLKPVQDQVTKSFTTFSKAVAA